MAASHYKWQQLPTKILSNQVTQQLINGDKMMLSQLILKKGAVVKKHSHLNEQFTCILSGTLKFTLGEDKDQSIIVNAGEVLHIPSGLPHSATALADTVDLDIFTPPRTDWLKQGGEDYFKV